MSWLLIVLVFDMSGKPVSVTMEKFASLQSCAKAVTWLDEAQFSRTENTQEARIKYVCLEGMK